MQVGTEKSGKAEVLSPMGWEKSCYFRATFDESRLLAELK